MLKNLLSRPADCMGGDTNQSIRTALQLLLTCCSLQVQTALQDIKLAWQHIAAGDYHRAGAAAAAARAAAEAAFLHPAVLAQLNFPESHKLGVYMPLFLPVSVPLMQGLVGQLAHYITKRRSYTAATARQ